MAVKRRKIVNGNKGRPLKFDPKKLTKEFIEYIRHLCLLGATDTDLLSLFGLGGTSRQSLYEYIANYPELEKAIHDGREGAYTKIAHALYSRAIGYTYSEETTEEGTDASGRQWEKSKKIIKHALPDLGCMVFFLKNRQPNRWSDKREYVMPENLVNRDLEDISSDDLKMMIDSLNKELNSKSKIKTSKNDKND